MYSIWLCTNRIGFSSPKAVNPPNLYQRTIGPVSLTAEDMLKSVVIEEKK